MSYLVDGSTQDDFLVNVPPVSVRGRSAEGLDWDWDYRSERDDHVTAMGLGLQSQRGLRDWPGTETAVPHGLG